MGSLKTERGVGGKFGGLSNFTASRGGILNIRDNTRGDFKILR